MLDEQIPKGCLCTALHVAGKISQVPRASHEAAAEGRDYTWGCRIRAAGYVTIDWGETGKGVPECCCASIPYCSEAFAGFAKFAL